MYAGVRGPKIRTPDKAVTDAITAYKKQLSEQE